LVTCTTNIEILGDAMHDYKQVEQKADSLFRQMSVEQAERFIEHTGYMFDVRELTCVINSDGHTVMVEDIDSPEQLMLLIDNGYTAVPF